MKGTTDLGAVTVVILELAAAMQTRVWIGPNVALGCPNHDVTLAGDLVQVVVARLRNFVFAAGVLPDPRPQITLLGLVILTSGCTDPWEKSCDPSNRGVSMRSTSGTGWVSVSSNS